MQLTAGICRRQLYFWSYRLRRCAQNQPLGDVKLILPPPRTLSRSAMFS